ncbi:MAG: hypothetical protein NTZ03_06770 [Actinobacteria bacterium]|nr:hypothetical protein [Actinomycetota bacterium]
MRDLRTEGRARTARWGISALIACAIVTLIAGPSLAVAPNPDGSTHAEAFAPLASYRAGTKIPPRIQWDANFGYCGEVSFVSAGLYYGQYLSQYDARAIASNNAPQSIASSQLLLGVNDVSAAKSMHLTTSAFNTAAQTNTTSFLTWVKANVKAGHPVAIGVFANQRRFYGSTNPVAGDSVTTTSWSLQELDQISPSQDRPSIAAPTSSRFMTMASGPTLPAEGRTTLLATRSALSSRLDSKPTSERQTCTH